MHQKDRNSNLSGNKNIENKDHEINTLSNKDKLKNPNEINDEDVEAKNKEEEEEEEEKSEERDLY